MTTKSLRFSVCVAAIAAACSGLFGQPSPTGGSPVSPPVTQLLAGTGVSLSPSTGIGVVTVTATATGLPSQTGNAGKLLTTNGTAASWTSAPTGITVNGLTITTSTGTLGITNAKAFSVTDNITLSSDGTGTRTLNISTGGTLGTAAFTAASAYEVPLTFSTGLTRTTNTIVVNTTQNIAKLSNLSTNGLVTTSGSDGTLSVTVPGTGVLTALGNATNASGGVVTYSGNIGAASGTSLSVTGGGSSISLTNGAGSGNQQISMLNQANQTYFGEEGASGGTIVTGSSAYSTVVGTSSSRSFHIFTNGTLGFTMSNAQAIRFNGSTYATAGTLVTDSSGNVSVDPSGGDLGSRVTSDVTNATATMSNLTNLSRTVTAGTHYVGSVQLFANDSVGVDGLAFDLGGGSATFTDVEFGFTAQPTGSTLGTITSTTATTAITLTAVSTSDAVYTITYGFTVNAGGTFIPRFAQNSHSTGTATVRKNSSVLTFTSSN